MINRYAHGVIYEDADSLLNSQNGKLYGYKLSGANSYLLTHYIVKGNHSFKDMQDVKEGIDYIIITKPTKENNWYGECQTVS